MSVSDKNNCFLDVYVWDTVRKLNDLGELTEQRHFGFWPNREFTVLDVPFHISAMEKSSLDAEVNYSASEPSFVPNKRYEIALDEEQYVGMKNEILEQSENIKSGKTRYTWLTSVNSLFYSMFSYDPATLENCSTISTKIMNAGGIPIYNNSVLWGISPIDVSYQLDNLIAQNKINADRIEYSTH